MPRQHQRRSNSSTTPEQSVTSENLNSSDELPDVALETNHDFLRIDRRRFTFALADLGTVEFTEVCDPVPLDTDHGQEIDLTQEDIPLKPQPPAVPPRSINKKGPKQTAPKKQTEKEIKKKEAAAERELQKQLKEEEKRAKTEYNKMYKPGESLKHIQLEMHPELSNQWFMEDVKREVAMLGVKVVESETRDVNVLAWTRVEPRMLVNDGGQMKLSSLRCECPHKLYVVQAADVLSGAARWQRCVDGGTYVVFGSQALMNKSSGRTVPISKTEYAKIINDLQIGVMVQCKAELVLVESSIELGLLVLRYTRATADTPYKKARREIDEQAEFYMRGDNKNCVTVDKDGNGLSRLWEQMIATLPMSSLEVARTLGANYESPRRLAQELQSPEGMTRVAKLGVSRTNVPGSKARKLGPEFTRKLHTLFTCEDGNKILD